MNKYTRMLVVERYTTRWHQRTRKVFCLGDSLSIKNPTWNSVGSNSGPRNENRVLTACAKRKVSYFR